MRQTARANHLTPHEVSLYNHSIPTTKMTSIEWSFREEGLVHRAVSKTTKFVGKMSIYKHH